MGLYRGRHFQAPLLGWSLPLFHPLPLEGLSELELILPSFLGLQ